MRPFSLVLAVALVACHPSPPPAAAPLSDPPAASTTPPPSTEPDVELRFFTEYRDYSGHGFSGAGEYFRLTGGAWTTAHCSTSAVFDPRAGAGAPTRTCGEWAPVTGDRAAVLDGLRGRSTDVRCDAEAELCGKVGLRAH